MSATPIVICFQAKFLQSVIATWKFGYLWTSRLWFFSDANHNNNSSLSKHLKRLF